MIVLDASAFIGALENDSMFRKLIEIADSEGLVAPDHFDIECIHALRKMERLGKISNALAKDYIAILIDLRCTRKSVLPFLNRVWHHRNNFSAYDAGYVALAENLDATLITQDDRLTRAIGGAIKTIRLD